MFKLGEFYTKAATALPQEGDRERETAETITHKDCESDE